MGGEGSMAIVDAHSRRLSAHRPAAVSVKPPPVDKSEYLYGDPDEDVDDDIDALRHRLAAARNSGGAVPAELVVDLERLIETRRIGNDPNFRDGRL